MQCLPDHSSLMTSATHEEGEEEEEEEGKEEEKEDKSTTPTTSLLAEELALGGMTMHVSWNGLKMSSGGINDASGIKGPLRIGACGL